MFKNSTQSRGELMLFHRHSLCKNHQKNEMYVYLKLFVMILADTNNPLEINFKALYVFLLNLKPSKRHVEASIVL